MKKKLIEMYGDKQFVAISDLIIPEYYSKSEIEGENRKGLYESIRVNGVQRPIVINTFPEREGVIIDGTEVYIISKELGIYDIPCYELCVPQETEMEYHYLFSITCNEYTIEEILEHIKGKNYGDYFTGIDGLTTYHDEVFGAGKEALAVNRKQIQHRKHSFLFRYDDAHKGYLETLTQMLDAKSQNEALLRLIVEVVEGRIAIC
jgi:hypothetical protein